jgi:hypothetical protein
VSTAFQNGRRFLTHDGDPLFMTEFLDILAHVGVKSAKLPPRSPGPERMMLFGEESLRTVVHNFVAHDHTERHHRAWQID